MAKTTGIAWTDSTWSPWWGCVKVSRGCEHCYADGLSKRYGWNVWGPAKTTDRRLFGDRHWSKPLEWNAEAARTGRRFKVFPSMCDPFEDHPMLIDQQYQFSCLIDSTPNIDWLVLTKRPENVMRIVPKLWRDRGFPANLWLGTSVEDQATADLRVPILQQTPANLRFLSVEPQLAFVDLDPFIYGIQGSALREPGNAIHWVIFGGESGAGARPFNTWWARRGIQQCRWAGVVPFLKQLGSKPVDSMGKPIKLKAYKGDDPTEWEESLRVQEFPESPASSLVLVG